MDKKKSEAVYRELYDEDKRFNAMSVALFLVLLVGDGFLYSNEVVSLVTAILLAVLAMLIAYSVKIADQWEKAVVLRMGKYIGLKGPGLFFIIPIIIRFCMTPLKYILPDNICRIAFNTSFDASSFIIYPSAPVSSARSA